MNKQFFQLAICTTLLLISSCSKMSEKKQVGEADPNVETADKSLRIVGGDATGDGAYPYYAALLQSPAAATNKNLAALVCGGTIISPTIFLTAAHCVVGVAITKFRVLPSGTRAINSVDASERIAVSAVLVHPNYAANKNMDIALVMLSTPVPVATLAPTKMPIIAAIDTPLDDLNNYAVTLGHGQVGFNTGGLQNALLRAYVQIAPCVNATDGKLAPATIQSYYVCAGLPGGGADSCQGDSGGPLMVANNNGVNADDPNTLIGIVSGGFKCAISGFPGQYTNVALHHNWICANRNGSTVKGCN